ncbi:hypothetical protein NC651_002215 [Populus alba x Populus x berolinensis]|nr:hypothetical protein NC651_002215 [Populus alba x Populus x berolinensis]
MEAVETSFMLLLWRGEEAPAGLVAAERKTMQVWVISVDNLLYIIARLWGERGDKGVSCNRRKASRWLRG